MTASVKLTLHDSVHRTRFQFVITETELKAIYFREWKAFYDMQHKRLSYKALSRLNLFRLLIFSTLMPANAISRKIITFIGSEFPFTTSQSSLWHYFGKTRIKYELPRLCNEPSGRRQEMAAGRFSRCESQFWHQLWHVQWQILSLQSVCRELRWLLSKFRIFCCLFFLNLNTEEYSWW